MPTGVPGVSWTVVKNPSLFEHVRKKSVSCQHRNIVLNSRNMSSRKSLRPPVRSQIVAKSYDVVPHTLNNWVNKHRKKHPDPDMEGASSDRIAEIKRLKAELREARTGD